MATVDELAARLDALEARLIAPLAAVPPITIGELIDVPTPGSSIVSPWTQEVSNRIIHRFATTTAMNAWAAANGSIACVTAAPGSEQWFLRYKSTWQQFAGAFPFGFYTLQGATSIPDNTGPKLAWTPIVGSTIPLAGDSLSATLPVRGWYRVDYAIGFGLAGANTGVRAAWFEIGDAVRYSNSSAPGNGSGGISVTGGRDIICNAGAAVSVTAFVGGAGIAIPLSIGTGGTVLSIRLIEGQAV